jgi:ribosomal protein S18 acetylase RimI-like enzyme
VAADPQVGGGGEAVTVRRLAPADARAYQTIRGEALAQAPLAFAASPEDDLARSAEFVVRSLADPAQAVFGAFAPGVAGMVGAYRDRHLKAAHKCHLFGLYVAPALRSAGVGRRLVEAALDFALTLPGVTQVHAGVTDRAPEAASLYRDLGFAVWGVEPGAMRIGGEDVAEAHLILDLSRTE